MASNSAGHVGKKIIVYNRVTKRLAGCIYSCGCIFPFISSPNFFMNKTLYLLFTLLVFSASVALAADPPGLGNPGSPDPIPVDGGLSLLAVSGGAYAWRKLRAKRAVKA